MTAQHKKGNPTAVAAQPLAGRAMVAQEDVRAQALDLTQGSLTRSIWILGVPMILEQLTISAFRLLDTFWVGQLGAAALAAVSVSGTVVWTVNQVGMGLGVGGAAIVARRVGERDSEGATLRWCRHSWWGSSSRWCVALWAFCWLITP